MFYLCLLPSLCNTSDDCICPFLGLINPSLLIVLDKLTYTNRGHSLLLEFHGHKLCLILPAIDLRGN